MRIVLIGRGKMGALIRETAAAAGDEIEATFGAENRRAAELAYESVSYLKGGEAGV